MDESQVEPLNDEALAGVAEEFRLGFRESSPPRLEDWLERYPSASRCQVFQALIQIEFDEIYRAGAEPSIASYSTRFPEYADELEQLLTTCSVHAGETPLTEALRQSQIERSISGVLPIDGEATASLQGTYLGRYRLDEKLGHGGFGEVWKGHDPELDRDVAIKIARRDRHAPEELIDHLLAEAKRAAKVSHPNIVTIHDVSRTTNGLMIVSEFIDGQTLAERLERGPLTLDEAITIASDIASALHHAHRNDLIHRDVKPGNILLRSNGQAVLGDFGLAATDAEILAEQDGAKGTVRYMSPEQARGEMQSITLRSDIFSLGLVLFQMLAGRLPYPPVANEVHLKQINKAPARSLRTVDDNADPELERICAKCLNRDPELRYASCLDLKDDLVQWQSAQVESASSITSASSQPATATTSTWRRYIPLILGSIAVAFSLLAWFGPRMKPAAITESPELPDQKSPSVAKTIDAEESIPDSPLTLKPGEEQSLPKLEPGEEYPLLMRKPVKISFDNYGRDFPVEPLHHTETMTFSVSSPYDRCLCTCDKQPLERPFRLQGTIRLANGIGEGGFAWGIREVGEFSGRTLECYYVTLSRENTESPYELSLVKSSLVPRGAHEYSFERSWELDSCKVSAPTQDDVPLRVDIFSDHCMVNYYGDKWIPVNQWTSINKDHNTTHWLAEGNSKVGIFSIGSQVTIRDLSLTILPE